METAESGENSAAAEIAETSATAAPCTTTTSAAATNTVSASKLNQLQESLSLEHHLMRVPFELYKKTIRSNHRAAEKEVSSVISSVTNSPDLSNDDALSHLNSLVSCLQGLKRKLEEGSESENLLAKRCKARLDSLESVNVDNLSEWNDMRVKRILVDYLLRMSYYDTAEKLAESCNIQDLVDIDVFQEAKAVVDALRNEDVGPALAWCADNKSRLKKLKSGFEFQLRLREFIELVRADTNMSAITFARKYLGLHKFCKIWGGTHMTELQNVIAALAFKSTTGSANLRVLLEPKQWDILVDRFKDELCRLYGMTPKPLLNIYLQAGLSALKTLSCDKGKCPMKDPLSQESFRRLALPLPYSKQGQSKILCYITKELMDSENPPQTLPNGYVYSLLALVKMAHKNEGNITCPRTGYACNFSVVRQVFV